MILDFFKVDLVEGTLTFFISLCAFILLSNLFVGQLVGIQLLGVVVVTEQFVVPIDLIGKSAFLNVLMVTGPSLMSSTGVWQ
jgi:hypothetical protein